VPLTLANGLIGFTYNTQSAEVRDEWMVILRALLLDIWQPWFETMHMAVPEIYQMHRFITKLNAKGRSQIRCLAISNERIYNLQLPEAYPLVPGKQKWALKIGLLKGIQQSNETPKILTFVTSLPKIKSHVSFAFKDEKEAQTILKEIQRLYFLQTSTHLEVDHDVKARKKSKTYFQKLYSN